MLPYHYAEMAYLCHVIKNFIFKVSENSQVLFLGLWAGHVCTRKQTIVSAIMRFWFVRDIWSYTSVFWLIDWLIGLLIHSLNHLLGKSQTAVCHPQQQKLSNWCAPMRCVERSDQTFLPCFKDPRSRSTHLQLQRFTTQPKLHFFKDKVWINNQTGRRPLYGRNLFQMHNNA